MRFSTRLVLASLLGFAGFSTDVDAHAKLVYPAAWNANPSKTVTCGVAQNANANPAMFKRTENILAGAGQTVDVKWTVVVGDGTGPITAKIDTTAKVNPTAADFTVNLAATADFPNRQPAVGPFTVRFTLPASLKCTGPGNTCTMRVASSSNWVACATIQLKDQLPQVAAQPPAPVVTQPPPTTTRPPTTTTQPPTTPSATTPNPGTITQTPPVVTDAPTDPPAVATDPPTPTPTTSTPTRDPKEYYPYPSALNNCQIAANLKTCTNINGQSVQLMGVSLEAIEQQAIEQIDFDMLNPAVLERPNTVGCRQALTDLICAQMFPPCQSDNQVVCTSTCQRVTNLCRPNTTMIIDETGSMSSHAQLFDCTNTKLGFTAIDQDTAGACPNVGTGERTPTTTTTTTTTPPFGTTQKPVNIASTGRNHASSLTSSSSTVVMGVVTLLLAFVARV